jgi:hypothetical protein
MSLGALFNCSVVVQRAVLGQLAQDNCAAVTFPTEYQLSIITYGRRCVPCLCRYSVQRVLVCSLCTSAACWSWRAAIRGCF